MAAEVKILIEGYIDDNSTIDTGDDKVQPTVVLVRDENIVMVVDPGILDDKNALIEALGQENLSVNEVNFVCITHSHFDHYANIGMFPNAKVLEFYGLWEGNTCKDRPGSLTENIKIMPTPGHDFTGLTVFVTTNDKSENPGVVAICGDVFWKENYPEDPYEDPYVSDPYKLEDSRKYISENADWIIPGHGGIYKNKSLQKAPSKKTIIQVKESGIRKLLCRKCGEEMMEKDKCLCRPFLCFRCCECEFECHLCSCHHRIFKK